MSNILHLPFWNVSGVKEHHGQYTVEATYDTSGRPVLKG